MSAVTAELAAWLSAWAAHGWTVDAPTAAQDAGLPLADLLGDCPDRFDALARAAEALERATLMAAPEQGAVRERLFDMLMGGFDWMQAHRAAMLAVLGARDPGVQALLADRTLRALNRVLDAAGDASWGASRAARLAGLALIHARALNAWRTDDTEDMAAVMRTLDEDLARAERAATEGVWAVVRGFSVSRATPPADDPAAG